METKFKICDEVFYLNTALWRIESSKVKGIKIVPTEIKKDEEGNDVLVSSEVLYSLDSGYVATEGEVFVSREDLVEFLREVGSRV